MVCPFALTLIASAGASLGGEIRAATLRVEEPDGPRATLFAQPRCTGDATVVRGERSGDEWVASTKVGSAMSFLADAKGYVTELVRGDPREPTFDRAYWGSAFSGIDGCQPLDDVPRVDVERRTFRWRDEKSVVSLAPAPSSPAPYQVLFSADSSMYMAPQVLAMKYSFDHSQKTPGAVLTRLLTGAFIDDYADKVNTFQAPRNARSNPYAPYNKADVLAKWFNFDTPTSNVTVLIDPDNWLLKDLQPVVSRVKSGRGIAAPSFYQGNSINLKRLWKRVCEKNCETIPDAAAVPYVMSTADMRTVAPLWKRYLDKLLDLPQSKKADWSTFNMQLEWCVEMVAFNLACAHAGVKMELEHDLQLRDVDVENLPDNRYYAIHVGRIWFPQDYKPAQKFHTPDELQWSAEGHQAWVKTYNGPVPWTGEFPQGMSLVSRATLEDLHWSQSELGPPQPSKFRAPPGPGGGGLFERMD
jgi:hypothetical protein